MPAPDRSGEPPERRSLVILNGGLSRRMGRDKASLPVGGSTLLEHLIARLSPAVDEVLVAGGVRPPIPGVHWVPDSLPGAGPLAGIAAGLRRASAPAAWVLACDLPDAEPALGLLLFRCLDGYDAAVPCPLGRAEGTCAVYRTGLAPRIEALLSQGGRSVLSLLEGSRVRYVEAGEVRTVDPELRSFRNLNTPEDYDRWLSER